MNFKRYLLRSHKQKVIAYRNAAVAAAFRPRHLKVSAQQIGAVLLLAAARILQRSHAARPAAVQIESVANQINNEHVAINVLGGFCGW